MKQDYKITVHCPVLLKHYFCMHYNCTSKKCIYKCLQVLCSLKWKKKSAVISFCTIGGKCLSSSDYIMYTLLCAACWSISVRMNGDNGPHLGHDTLMKLYSITNTPSRSSTHVQRKNCLMPTYTHTPSRNHIQHHSMKTGDAFTMKCQGALTTTVCLASILYTIVICGGQSEVMSSHLENNAPFRCHKNNRAEGQSRIACLCMSISNGLCKINQGFCA